MPGLYIPFYCLNDTQIVLIDSGFAWTGRKIRQRLDSLGLRVTAIIHTHIHIDHICGDAAFLEDEHAPAVYGSRLENDLTLQSYKDNMTDDPYAQQQAAEVTPVMTAFSSVLIDLDGNGQGDRLIAGLPCRDLTVAGETFQVIDAPGHSPLHHLIVTPDGVCCLGDALMYGLSLEKAKSPYIFDLIQDIGTIRKIAGLSYSHYCCAHEGIFPAAELAGTVDANLAIFRGILEEVARLEQAEPSMEVLDATRQLVKKIGIHDGHDVFWVISTLRQYIDYYQQTKSGKLPGD